MDDLSGGPRVGRPRVARRQQRHHGVPSTPRPLPP